ncbi:hypothetical protein KDA_15420 [Dictyobacter alpinus]|uniref:Uncharacterized protein n=1 Tax=Dictyobacter alpinus TaxID=2014873 RepID=A0A402B3Y9_9CHLR|nr:hypothetical protein [Dictyobacter alpinus]GCE26058.1 hypothetical protein KDA_15420 [Dictyobacter alpinus]
MSQNYNSVAKRPRRTRVPRNRPVLVTGGETETQEGVSHPTTEDLTLDTVSAATETVSEPVATPKRLVRLPKFFSKVEHSEQDDPADTKEVVEARMARAKKNMNGKAAITKAEEAADAKAGVPKAAAKAAPPAKLFKPRHFIGMVVYLIGANAVLPLERTFAINSHIERELFRVPGVNLPVTTSFLFNIITLIVVLYVLVALDLLPSGKQFAAGRAQTAGKGKSNSGSQGGTPTPKVAPPAMRQGVKGAHDDLYQAYRSSQRKKR